MIECHIEVWNSYIVIEIRTSEDAHNQPYSMILGYWVMMSIAEAIMSSSENEIFHWISRRNCFSMTSMSASWKTSAMLAHSSLDIGMLAENWETVWWEYEYDLMINVYLCADHESTQEYPFCNTSSFISNTDIRLSSLQVRDSQHCSCHRYLSSSNDSWDEGLEEYLHW